MAVLILPADTLELGVTPGDRTETPISIVDDDGKLLQNGSLAVNINIKFTEILVCLKNDSYTVTEGGDVTVGIQINRPAGTSFSVTLTPSPGTATGTDTDTDVHMHMHTHTYKHRHTEDTDTPDTDTDTHKQASQK